MKIERFRSTLVDLLIGVHFSVVDELSRIKHDPTLAHLLQLK
jgi:hypothetical protein